MRRATGSRQRYGKNARYLYTLAFDLDGVVMPQLPDTLRQMDMEDINRFTEDDVVVPWRCITMTM